MKKLKIFKNVSKHKLVATAFSLALIASMQVACVEKPEETYVYVVHTSIGSEVALTEKEYNELLQNNDDTVIIRSYGGTIAITKEELYNADYQKQNSLQR